MSDDLRERIERRMREAVDAAHNAPGVLPLTPTAHPAFDAAVSVCEAIVREERERWGHVARCQCLSIARHEPGCVAKKNRGEDCGPHYPFHDPRCAPQEATEPSPASAERLCPTCHSWAEDWPIYTIGGPDNKTPDGRCGDPFHSTPPGKKED